MLTIVVDVLLILLCVSSFAASPAIAGVPAVSLVSEFAGVSVVLSSRLMQTSLLLLVTKYIRLLGGTFSSFRMSIIAPVY